MSDPILVERSKSIATVTLNRPKRRNAITFDMWRSLNEAFRDLSADDEVRCVVLRGAGKRAFAAGADISEFASLRSSVAQARIYAAALHAAMVAVAECRHPTVAMIRGACVGGGLELAAACDLRICGRSSTFGIPVNRLGLTMAHEELTALVDLVGPAAALEIVLEGALFGARRASTMGLVNRVVADKEVKRETYATARRIGRGAPLVNRWHKKFVRRLTDPAPLTEAELSEGYAAFDTEDFQTGLRAFIDKETPRFAGR